MAGITLSIDDLKAAVKRYCEANGKMHSVSDDSKITIFSETPTPGDPIIWLEGGALKGNDIDFCLNFAEEFIKSPNLPAKPNGRTNIAQAPRKPGNGQMVQSSGNLTARDVIDYINQKATEQEAYLFAEFCRRKGADPMTKQVYLVVYEGSSGRNVSFIAGKEYFTEKAEAHPQFDGFQAGIILRPKDGGDLIHREGTFYLPSEEVLLGGWAEVHRKDRKIPVKAEVALAEYNTGKSMWSKMPSTMIRKVAIVQALREAFPANFGGIYDSSEMNQAGVIDVDPEREVTA